MIDLHMHTNCSDGVLEPMEILKKAEELRLECISITDHDTCKAYEIVRNSNIKEYYSGILIPGCELRTSHNNIPIEILGYYINPDIINEWKNKYYSPENVLEKKNRSLESLKESCRRNCLKFDNDIKVTNVKQSFAQDLFNDIKKYDDNKRIFNLDEWFSLEIFLRQYCSNPNSEFFVDRTNDYPNIKEVVDVIKDSGGLAFLAHPLVYGVANGMQFIESILEECKLDGLECYYSAFSKNQIQDLLSFCSYNNLLVSGGSDFHGTASKSDVSLGIGKGNLNISIDVIKPWLRGA